MQGGNSPSVVVPQDDDIEMQKVPIARDGSAVSMNFNRPANVDQKIPKNTSDASRVVPDMKIIKNITNFVQNFKEFGRDSIAQDINQSIMGNNELTNNLFKGNPKNALSSKIVGEYIVQKTVHKRFDSGQPFIRGEIQYVRPLTYLQKFGILLINLFDSVLLSAQIFIACSSQSYTTMPFLLLGLNGMRLLKKGYCHENIVKKMGNQLLLVVLSLIITVTKVALLVSRKVDVDQVDDSTKEYFAQFGFRFNYDDVDLTFKLQAYETFYSESMTFVIALLTLVFLKVSLKAANNDFSVTRKLKRRIPSHIVNQGQEQKTANPMLPRRKVIEESQKSGQPDKKVSLVKGYPSETSKIKKESNFLNVPAKINRVPEIKYKEVEETIYENSMDHPYFTEQKFSIFFFLIAILVLDISIYQSLVQLVLGLFLLALQFIWVFKKGDFVQNMKKGNVSDLFSYIKYIFVVQTFFIMVLNIGKNEKYFMSEDMSLTGQVFSQLFKLFGIINDEHFISLSNYLKLKKFSDRNPLLPHLILATTFMTFQCIQNHLFRDGHKLVLEEQGDDQSKDQLPNSQVLRGSVNEPLLVKKSMSKRLELLNNIQKNKQTTQLKNETAIKSIQSGSFDGTIIHKVEDAEVSEQDKIEKQEESGLKESLIAFSLLWVCRINMILYIYLYHDWQALFILIWVQHSMLSQSLSKFRVETLKFYMPFFIVIYLFYYVVNINGLLTEQQFEGNQYWGVFKFYIPVLEVLFMQFNNFCIFAWIKSCENLNEDQNNISIQGVKLMNHLSAQDSYTAYDMLLLTFPYYEGLLLLAIVISGLNKVDLYHVLCLFIFVAFLNYPNKKYQLTIFTIYYAFFFIFVKYIYSILYCTDVIVFGSDVDKIMDVIGFTTVIVKSDSFAPFEYVFKWQQWLLLLIGYSQYFLLRLFNEKAQFEVCQLKAQNNLKRRFPLTNQLFQRIYILKRNVILIVTFAIFYSIILLAQQRTLINWVFLALTNLLIFKQISIKSNLAPQSKSLYWKLIIVYSSVIILVNITYIFLNLDLLQEQVWVQTLADWFPQWMKDGDNISSVIGLIKQPDDDKKEVERALYVQFLPYLLFFCLSIYCGAQQSLWLKNDARLALDILQLPTELKSDTLSRQPSEVQDNSSINDSKVDQSLTEIKQEHEGRLKGLTQGMNHDKDELKNLQGLQQRIMFTGIYFSYKNRFYWPLLDLIALYNNMIVYFVVTMLNIYWWFNLVNILQLLTLIIFMIQVGREVQQLKSTQAKRVKASMDSIDEDHLKFDEESVQSQKKQFDTDVNNLIMRKRLLAWNIHFIIVNMAIILLVLSEHLEVFEKIQTNVDIKNVFKTLMYYMFISGVFHQKCNEPTCVSFWHQIWGYLIIYVLCLFERILLSWLVDRFQCTEENLQKITVLEQRITLLQDRIEKVHQKIRNFDAIVKVEMVKAIRQQKIQKNKGNEGDREIFPIQEEEEIKFDQQIDSSRVLVSNRKKTKKVEDLFRFNSKASESNLHVEGMKLEDINREQNKLLKDILSKILVDTDIQIMKGIKTVLEEIIILSIWTSAIFKMNIQSFIDFTLIMMFYVKRTQRTMYIILSVNAVVFLVRLGLILSNMDKDLISPMQYPVMFMDVGTDYLVPWIKRIYQANETDDNLQISWFYWLTFLNFRVKQSKLMQEFVTIFLGYVYYQTCQFWLLSENFEVWISEETKQKVELYYQNKIQIRTLVSKAGIQIHQILTEEDIDLICQDSGIKIPDDMNTKLKDILQTSWKYSLYKAMQRGANIYYSKLMVMMIMILSILSNTLFSLGYIMLVCCVMFLSKLFYDVESARRNLLPLLQKLVIPYMLVEILIQLLFQVPVIYNIFKQEDNEFLKIIPKVLGVQQYYVVEFNSISHIPELEIVTDIKSLGQLWCKAIAYFLISLQIQIIQSKSFDRLKDYISLGQIRGQAMTYRFNNNKIRMYLRYQEKNFDKEKMMVTVKQTMDKWRKLFISQAFEGETKLGLQHDQQKMQQQIINTESPVKNNFDDEDKKSQSDIQVITQEGKLKQSKSVKIQDDQREDIDAFMNLQKGESGTGFEKSQELQDEFQYQSVNFDYLAVRRLSQKNLSLKPVKFTKGKENFDDVLNGDKLFIKMAEQDKLNEEKLNQKYQERRDQLPWHVKLYVYLRKNVINPIQLVNDRNRIKNLLLDASKGEVSIKSTIEQSIINDLKQEAIYGNGESCNYHLAHHTQTQRMLGKYCKLLLQIFQSNLDFIVYFLMIYQAIQNPGWVTIVYPLSIFGYALLEETRPKKQYWYFIMIYTQILMIFEFILSLGFWQQSNGIFIANINLWSKRYYIGLQIVTGNDAGVLFDHFAPKVIMLFFIMILMQNEIALGLFNQKETEKESLPEAYLRYLKGQFGVQIDDFLEDNDVEDANNFEAIEYYYKVKGVESVDDFDVKYNQDQDKQLLDKEQIKIYMEGQRLVRSENDIFQGSYSQIDKNENDDENEENQNNKFLKHTKFFFKKTFVDNAYIGQLFPSLKIQKPGYDFYSPIVLIQLVICLYIVLFYANMDASGSSIIDQISNNSFSGYMVFSIFGQICLMVMERIIYKSKSFEESVDTKITTQKKMILDKIQDINSKNDVSKSRNVINNSASRQSVEDQTMKSMEMQKQGEVKISMNQLLAKSKVGFREVSKFYFQWFNLILIHMILFFVLPYYSNLRLSNMQSGYCSKNLRELELCNDLNDNGYIIAFYVIFCIYFYLSALQIKKGLPELMQTYFMMGDYTAVNRNVFNIFMNVPFLFELRIFIDWTVTKTALDVFQWIKLAQIQADLYKAKSTNKMYAEKPLGDKITRIWKFLNGYALVVLIVALIIGPMFVFSTAFAGFGSINHIQAISLTLDLQITDYQGNQNINQNFYKQASTYNVLNVTQNETQAMGFQYNTDLSLQYTSEDYQFIIMNSADDIWRISDSQNKSIVAQFEYALNDTSVTKPKSIDFVLSYQFTRAVPVYALNPTGKQTFNVYDSSKNESLDASKQFIGNLMKMINFKTCDSFGPKESFNQSISYNGDQFNPVSTLGLTLAANQIQNNTDGGPNDWNKDLRMIYDPCDKYPRWDLLQDMDQDKLEYKTFQKNITQSQGANIKILDQISMIVASQKISIAGNYQIWYIYIVFVYAVAKLFRTGLVPVTDQIVITDARDPTQILLLCETIHMYRLKQMLKEEEKLYFLLIDIMRSPHIFKEISGSSIKDDPEPIIPKPSSSTKNLRRTALERSSTRRTEEREAESFKSQTGKRKME